MRLADILLNLASNISCNKTYVDAKIVLYSRSSTIVGVYSKYFIAVAVVGLRSLRRAPSPFLLQRLRKKMTKRCNLVRLSLIAIRVIMAIFLIS